MFLWKGCGDLINHFPQSAGSEMTVIAFLIFPARTNNFNIESLRGQAIAKQLRDTVSHIQGQIGKRIFEKSLRYLPACGFVRNVSKTSNVYDIFFC